MADPLPYFARAPVVEKVLAVQFGPIRGLSTGHLGLFLGTLGAGWTNAGESDPVGQLLRGDELPLLFTDALVLDSRLRRLRFRDASGTRLLQIENGWFVHNWRRSGTAEYPRFEALLPEFIQLLAMWSSYVKDQGLESVKPNVWEVSYVNAIKRGTIWQSPSDWPDVFPALLTVPKLSHVGSPVTGALRWTFPLIDGDGTLEITFDHRHDAELKNEALRMTQVARGRIVDPMDLEKALRIGRDSIVRTFDLAASETAKKYWGKT